MNNLLYVWAYPQDEPEPVICGVLELLGGRRCLFDYDPSWLEHPKRFVLSPDMPLRAGSIEPPAGLDLHPIFEDAGPDRWGQNVINKVFNPQRRSPIEYLELAGEDRIGALGFSRSRDEYLALPEQAFCAADLSDLVRAANALSSQMPIDDNLRQLLRPGASAGGARPKAIIRHENEDWIAKFDAEGDECDVAAVEHASLRLASQCGIDVPDSQLVKVGARNVLLVKRFDREDNNRVHFASARTMLLAEGIQESAMGYSDLADVARRLAADPKRDCEQLFRRMTLNVLIENTDDHDKNHAFLYKNGNWHLSPAYDFQPQLQGIGYHQLRIGKEGHVPAISNVLSEANRFLLRREDAEQIVEDILAKTRGWQTVFETEGVSRHDIDLCASYVLRPSLFLYGVAPEVSVEIKDQGIYVGKVVAIDDKYVYQSLGRNSFARHDRIALGELPLPGQTFQVQYRDGKPSITERSHQERGR